MTLIDALVVSLNLDASKFKAGQAEANTSLKAIGEGATRTGTDVQKVAQGMAQGFAKVRTELLGLLGLFLAGRSVGGLTRDITNQDAALGRLSRRLGMTTEDLSAWDRAAQSAGAASGEAMGSVATLSAAFEKFRLTGQGGDTFIPYLSRLGVHLRNASGQMKDANEQQLEFARAFQAQDRIDPKATDFLGGQIPGMSQGMIDFLRRGPEFVQQRLDKQRQIGLPTRQDAENAQDILTQLGYIDDRAHTFGRHLLNDVSPGITRVLTRLGDWLDRHLPGWYAKVDPIIRNFMGALDRLNFDHVAAGIETFGKRVWGAFEALANWQPPAWMEWIKSQLYGTSGKDGEGKQGAAYKSEGILQKFTDGSFFGQNNYLPAGTTTSDAMTEAATRNGVPVDFARKIFAIEKGVDVDGKALTSKAGAIGAGQLMPGTAKDLGVDPYDLRQNVDGSTRYMHQLLERFHGNQAAAAAAYNTGPNNPAVQRFADTGDASGLPAETRDYVQQFGRRWFEADTSGRNANLHAVRLLDRLLRAPAELRQPDAPNARDYQVGPGWFPPSVQVPTLKPGTGVWRGLPAQPANDTPEPKPETPDFARLRALLNGDPGAVAANNAVPTAAQRWGNSTVHNTSHHDNSSITTINGPINVHTQAKDAHGIARDIEGAMKARMSAAQANRGLR